ncbi:MAG: hypothetical protein ABUL65_01095, partial [Opitutus sp.]
DPIHGLYRSLFPPPTWSPVGRLHSNGYDGQFYAQIALDPLLRDPTLKGVVDAPVYRARRILVPATAAILGLGRPWWTLQAYAVLNVACWLGLGWLLQRDIGRQDWVAFARWAGCMFSLGVLDSVGQSLVDLPALLLLVLATRSTQVNGSALWLALSALAKETSLLGAIALQSEKFRHRSEAWRAGLTLAIVALPLAMWSFYVQARFGDTPGGEGLGNFTWPLIGLLGQAQLSVGELLHGNFDGRYSFAPIAIAGLATQTAFLWRIPQIHSPWWRIGAAYAVLLLFLGPWVWSGYWAACRAMLPMT